MTIPSGVIPLVIINVTLASWIGKSGENEVRRRIGRRPRENVSMFEAKELYCQGVDHKIMAEASFSQPSSIIARKIRADGQPWVHMTEVYADNIQVYPDLYYQLEIEQML